MDTLVFTEYSFWDSEWWRRAMLVTQEEALALQTAFDRAGRLAKTAYDEELFMENFRIDLFEGEDVFNAICTLQKSGLDDVGVEVGFHTVNKESKKQLLESLNADSYDAIIEGINKLAWIKEEQ